MVKVMKTAEKSKQTLFLPDMQTKDTVGSGMKRRVRICKKRFGSLPKRLHVAVHGLSRVIRPRFLYRGIMKRMSRHLNGVHIFNSDNF